MNAKRELACAASTPLKWTDLNWAKYEAVVKKLQVRIAKAVSPVSPKRCDLLIT
jgi:hypothetical protein